MDKAGLHDKVISVNTKMLMLITRLRSVLLHELDCLSLTKIQTKKIQTTEANAVKHSIESTPLYLALNMHRADEKLTIIKLKFMSIRL